MTQLTLNKPQIQAALNDLVTQPSGLNAMLEMTLNAFMKAERDVHLSQSTDNKGNGYRRINGLGLGESLKLQIPRDRLNQFKPWILEVMRESQEQTQALFFELYSKGLTTRDIESITQSIYGQTLSRSAVSRITASYSEDMTAFRARKLESDYPIIYLDATFISTRRETVSKEAYYIALGVKADATREVIGLYNAPTESASLWHDIMEDLKARGVNNCNLFVIDNLTGFDEAIEKVFPHARVQKCVLHLKRNVLKRVKVSHRAAVAEGLKEVFDMHRKDDSLALALARAALFCKQWEKYYPHLKCFKDVHYMRYYFAYLHYAYEIWNMLYTTNWIERLNKDFKPND